MPNEVYAREGSVDDDGRHGFGGTPRPRSLDDEVAGLAAVFALAIHTPPGPLATLRREVNAAAPAMFGAR